MENSPEIKTEKVAETSSAKSESKAKTFETKEHIVEEGVFIPQMGINYTDKPDEPLLFPPKIRSIDFENGYNFLDRSFTGRMQNFLIYAGIYALVYPLNRIRYGLKIEGRENIKKNKALLKNGAMTIANHVLRWDFPTVLQALGHRRSWFPARTSNFESGDAFLIKGAGGIPIPRTLSATRHFNEAFDTLAKEKRWLHVFPESCRWDWYEPIRPFKIGAFKMAYRYKYPIVPMAFTYRKPTGIWKLFGTKHPLVTLKIGEPIEINKPENMSRNDYCAELRRKTHEAVCRLAGIKQNKWPAEAD